jgi:hypothetical protein
MKKILLVALLVVAVLLIGAQETRAVCPICTVAVIGGVGLSQYLGIDDTITGLWIGGLAVSLIFWTVDWLNQKKIHFFSRNLLIVLGYYAMIVLPLWFSGILNHPLNKIWGFDKLLLGMFFGSLGFLLGAALYPVLKKANNGKPHFPFEKVVLPIIPLVILSLIFYFIVYH